MHFSIQESITQRELVTEMTALREVEDISIRKATEYINEYKSALIAIDKTLVNGSELNSNLSTKLYQLVLQIVYQTHMLLRPDSAVPEGERHRFATYLQQEMLPHILLTDTIDRFFSKPQGYAGDYLTIDKIYTNNASGRGRLGPVIDRIYLDAPTSKAVRNRRRLLVQKFHDVLSTAGGEVAIFSIACGPAREVFDFYESLDLKEVCRFTLLDFDYHALAFVSDKMKQSKTQRLIRLVNENILYLIMRRSTVTIPKQDLIYSIGLIDYLEDKIVISLLNYIHENLKEGGRVILGNFHTGNIFKEYLDVVVEWRLIHRNEDQLIELFKKSKFGRACSFWFEEERINIFAECIK